MVFISSCFESRSGDTQEGGEIKPGPLNTVPAEGSLQLSSGSVFCCEPGPQVHPDTLAVPGPQDGSHTHCSLRVPACEEAAVAPPGAQGEGSGLIQRKPFGSSKPHLMKRELENEKQCRLRAVSAALLGCSLQAAGKAGEAAQRSCEMQGLGLRTPSSLCWHPQLGSPCWDRPPGGGLWGTWLLKGCVAAQKGQGYTRDLCSGRHFHVMSGPRDLARFPPGTGRWGAQQCGEHWGQRAEGQRGVTGQRQACHRHVCRHDRWLTCA